MTRIHLDLNGIDDALEALEQGIRQGVRRTPRHPGFREGLTQGIADHFNVLGHGGSLASLQGNVSWPDFRSALTLDEREERGLSAFPMLTLTGDMRNAYVRDAEIRTQTSVAGDFTTTLRAGKRLAELKARKHHEGGQQTAVFEQSGIATRMKFPQRPFIFWDADMVDSVQRTIIDSIKSEVAKRAAL